MFINKVIYDKRSEMVIINLLTSALAWWFLNMLVHGEVGKSYNVGSPQAITLAQLAEKVANHFPIRPKINLGVSSDRNLRRSKFVPDVSLEKNSLKLSITVDLNAAPSVAS
jgi:dTDP-glucose 4,6-dehydratase